MKSDYVLLAEKEAMWANMLAEVLKNNRIPYVSQPVYGAGLTLKTLAQERLRILVPEEDRERAAELFRSIFPSEDV